MSLAGYLPEYCERQGLPVDEPISSRGEAVLEDRPTTLLRGSRWSDYAWHSLRRGGTASCWNQKPGLPYFKWSGGWASTGVTMRYATAFVDHGVLASLALPCPGSGVGEPQVVNCLSLWGSAMFGADTVEESLGYVGSVLAPALSQPGVVAVKPHATVVRGGGGGARGHESDSSSTRSEASSSCESSDSDVRIIEPPVGKGVTAGPAFRISTEERPAGSSHSGGAGRRKRKRQAAPPTTRERPGRRRVRASPVILKGGASWPAGWSGGCLLRNPLHNPALCSWAPLSASCAWGLTTA